MGFNGRGRYQDQFPLDVFGALQTVVAPGAERAAVDVRCKVADAG